MRLATHLPSQPRNLYMYMTISIAHVEQYASTSEMLDNDYGPAWPISVSIRIPKNRFERDYILGDL